MEFTIWQYILFYLIFNVAYVARLLMVFMPMMWYFNHVDHDGWLWKTTKYPWYAVAGTFLVFDVLYNYVLITYTFELPRSFTETVSARLGRYVTTLRDSELAIDRWRYGLAKFFCRILNKADPNHCARMAQL